MTDATSQSRGDQTREALVHAALDVFGHAGFDAATTRTIAAAAGVNQALIGYHFGGKQGLYRGAIEHIVQRMQERLLPVAEQVSEQLAAVPRDAPGQRALALQLLVTIFDALHDTIAGGFAEGWVRLILREQQDPTEAFGLLYNHMLARLLALVTRLVAMASGLQEDSEACRIRALMIFGQVMVFHGARATTALHLGWQGIGPDQLAALKTQFRHALEAQFPEGGVQP
ncbi:MAG: CerR family C-terminal domain-containing protein [Pseudomonadales bacterium]|nr:CerR family C-terminal domain-containing protein [Pseudomonadales bacterium]MCP5189132.1 CerR family C-terminal domain-containing protein [Pseudomonadales bacterium]